MTAQQTGKRDLARAPAQERVGGWRGWLDDREMILRRIEGRSEPLWSRTARWLRYVWLCTKLAPPRLRCLAFGHEPSPRVPEWCRRCGAELEEEGDGDDTAAIG